MTFSLSTIFQFLPCLSFLFIYFGSCFSWKWLKIHGRQSTFEWGIKRLIWGSVSRPHCLAYLILESFGFWELALCWTTSNPSMKIFFSGQFNFFKEVIFLFLLCMEDASSQLFTLAKTKNGRSHNLVHGLLINTVFLS